MRFKSPLPLPSSQRSRRPHKCPTSYLLQLHWVMGIHFAGLGQVSHNKWFVFWQFLISDWTFDDWIYLCYSVSVWIFSRFLTWKFGFWEPSQQCLDLSCLPVLICLVSWSAETSKFSVIWRSAGQGNKQHIHSSAGRKPENNNSSLKSRKQSFDIDVNHPPVCQSLRVLQQFYLSYLVILKSWDNLF